MDALPSDSLPTRDINPDEQSLVDERTIAETNGGSFKRLFKNFNSLK